MWDRKHRYLCRTSAGQGLAQDPAVVPQNANAKSLTWLTDIMRHQWNQSLATRIGSPIAAILALTACTGGAQQTGKDIAQDAGYGIVRNLSPDDLAALQQTCLAAKPAVDAVMADPNVPKTVKDVAAYPYSFCYQLVTGARGNVADQSSLTWLPKVLNDVQIAAKIAGYVLPVILPFVSNERVPGPALAVLAGRRFAAVR